jgi:hypothetical protein
VEIVTDYSGSKACCRLKQHCMCAGGFCYRLYAKLGYLQCPWQSLALLAPGIAKLYYVNGGNSDTAMCAGLIDMPGARRQWLVGSTLNASITCDIQCATKPRWNIPAGATTEFDTVSAGASNVYRAADGADATVVPLDYFAVK